MRRLATRFLSIGADPSDDEDARLRKVVVLAAVAMVVVAATVWGLIYAVAGAPRSAFVPWSYVVVAAISVPLFARTRRYDALAATQLIAFLVLPFLLMWSLGGWIAGSAVALWAWLSPLAARTLGHRRAAVGLFGGFAMGTLILAYLEPRLGSAAELDPPVIIGFFVLNVVAVAGITLVLIDASTGGREGTLASMRGVVRRYFSADVADAILADPGRQELGGELAEVSILFADLGGYTTFSGDRSPHEVVDLLNTLFGAALPAIHAEGGTPVQLPGDAIMAIFGAPRRISDHAIRAARAALALQAACDTVAHEHPGWPRFRVGINTGEALVGNIGSDEFRNFTAIGDTVNMAQRLQTIAQPGQIVTGRQTAAELGAGAVIEWLDEVQVKGKADPVHPGVLVSLAPLKASSPG